MSDECFSQRNYDHILKQLKDRAPYTLAFADFNEHFARRIDKQRNYVYCEGPKGDGDIYECLLFGDIASTDNGTINEAAGNYYVNQGKPITDSSRIKDVLVLQVPGLAPEKLVHIFQNQIVTLNQIREADELEEAKTCEKVTFVKEALRSSSLDPRDPGDMIAVHLPDKYVVPNEFKFESPSKSNRIIKKRGISTEKEDDKIKKQDVDMGEKGAPIVPTGDAIHVGALYDPDLLPDHKGNFFKHVHAKLVQRDIRDCKGDLIPPWEMYSKLRQCTMVLVRATLYCWVIRNKEGSGVKKIYHVMAKSIRVLGESDLDYKIPPVPILPQGKYTNAPSSTSTPKKSAAAFESFKISHSPSPAKKSKSSTRNKANLNAKASSSKS